MENKIICMRGHEERSEEIKAFFLQNGALRCTYDCRIENFIYYIDPITEAVRATEEGERAYDKLLPHLTELPPLEEKIEEVEFWLKPFDKVVVRDEEGLWECNKFSHKVKEEGCQYTFNCLGNNWECCLPFNKETEKLLGTYDAPKTKYVFKGEKGYFDEE